MGHGATARVSPATGRPLIATSWWSRRVSRPVGRAFTRLGSLLGFGRGRQLLAEGPSFPGLDDDGDGRDLFSQSPFSTSGSRMSGGRLHGYEHNPQLQGRARAIAFEEMRRTDPDIESAISARLNTLLGLKWRAMAPLNPTPRALEALAYANEVYGCDGVAPRMRGGLAAALAQAYTFEQDGYRYMELMWRVDDDGDGTPPRAWLDGLSDCEPYAHQEWDVDPVTHELRGVWQMRPTAQSGGQSHRPYIPAEKLVLFTRARTGLNFEGRGLLRSVWVWWELKRVCYDLIGIATERFAVPAPIIRKDYEKLRASRMGDAAIKEAIENARRSAREFTSFEKSFLETVVGIDFDIYGAVRDYDPGKLKAVIDLCGTQIYATFALAFMKLGITDEGSHSVGIEQHTFFRRDCIATANQVGERLTEILAQLVRWNFPDLPRSQYPTMAHEGLQEEPLLIYANNLAAWAHEGVIDFNLAAVNKFRHLMGLPSISQAEHDAYQAARQAVAVRQLPAGVPVENKPEQGTEAVPGRRAA